MKQFHSEASRQEVIGKYADRMSQDIVMRLLEDDAEASEIGGDMLGFMEPRVMAQLVRYALCGCFASMRLLLVQEMDKSIQRVADHRAIRYVEETDPAYVE